MRATTFWCVLIALVLAGFAEYRLMNLLAQKEQNSQQVKAWQVETSRGHEARQAALFEKCVGLCAPGQVCAESVGDKDRCLTLCVTVSKQELYGSTITFGN